MTVLIILMWIYQTPYNYGGWDVKFQEFTTASRCATARDLLTIEGRLPNNYSKQTNIHAWCVDK